MAKKETRPRVNNDNEVQLVNSTGNNDTSTPLGNDDNAAANTQHPNKKDDATTGTYSSSTAMYNVGSDDFILVEEIGPKRKVSVKETIDAMYPWMENKLLRSFTMKNALKKFPIITWLPKYTTEDAVGDLVAGITVGLTVIPQSLAYANIAGLPPQYGLYGSFLGAFMYIFLGSCKDVPMGPTAIISILTYQTLHAADPNGLGPEFSTLLCFLCGVIQLFIGLSGLGIIIDFVSGPVSSGFTSAVALLIITSQIKDILGVRGGGSTFPQMIENLLNNIENIRLGDTILGIVCIIILLLMRLVADVKIGKMGNEGQHSESDHQSFSISTRLINKTIWLIGTSRNAILVLICGIAGKYYSQTEWFQLIGDIPPGLPTFELPHFTARNDTVSFFEMVHELGSGVIVVPLVAVLENIAICKAFAHGKPIDASQEIFAIGLCNIGNSLVHGYPGTGSLSRSAVNNSSGVRTPMGGLYTGVLVVLALLFFTPYFYFIPKACLAAVIIAAVVFMVEVRVVKPIYRSKKSDLIPGLATFVACLILPLEIGILVGIGLNLVSILYHAARPKISIEIHKTRAGIEYLLITPDRCLIFPSVDYVRNLVTKHSMKKGIPVVIDCSHIYGADFTAAKVIEILTQDFCRRGQGLFFYNLKPSIAAIFEGVQPKNFFIYYDKHELDTLLRNLQYSS